MKINLNFGCSQTCYPFLLFVRIKVYYYTYLVLLIVSNPFVAFDRASAFEFNTSSPSLSQADSDGKFHPKRLACIGAQTLEGTEGDLPR